MLGNGTVANSRTTVVLSPPPTPNGPLHVGHLSGPYLAADVAVRAARRRGEKVLSVCGLDDHQNYVVAAARAADLPTPELRDANADRIKAVFGQARIGHDLFIEPLVDPEYRDGVARLLDELTAAGAFGVQEWSARVCSTCALTMHHAYVAGLCCHCRRPAGGGTCEGCGGFLTAGDLLAPRCTGCGGRVTSTQRVRGPVLRLADYRDGLQEVWRQATLPPRIRTLVEATVAGGLPTIPLTYPTDWGIGPLESGHRIDVWAEMALGYLYALGRQFDPTAADLSQYRAAWSQIDRVWAFLGLDNGFYYSVMFPAIFLAAGLDPAVIGGLVVNEFYALDGAKFSTSRNHAVWASDLLTEASADVVRTFLCWDRPGSFVNDFTRARFAEVTGPWHGAPVAGDVSPADLDRAENALTFEYFAPDLAARCLALGIPADPTSAGAKSGQQLLELLTGASRP